MKKNGFSNSKSTVLFVVLLILGVLTETGIFYFLGGERALKMFWPYIPISIVLFSLAYWGLYNKMCK
jgi:hypothetical protein